MIGLAPEYIRQIPNVNALERTSVKPHDDIIRMKTFGFGNRRTEAGRYL